jgi:NADH:ubiquinone oxidoreductase subunit 2 (subunit N)
VIGVVNTVIAAYYYLRVIRAIVFEDAVDESKFSADKPILVAAGLAAIGAGVFGIAPFLMLDLAEKALSIVPAMITG